MRLFYLHAFFIKIPFAVRKARLLSQNFPDQYELLQQLVVGPVISFQAQHRQPQVVRDIRLFVDIV